MTENLMTKNAMTEATELLEQWFEDHYPAMMPSRAVSSNTVEEFRSGFEALSKDQQLTKLLKFADSQDEVSRLHEALSDG